MINSLGKGGKGREEGGEGGGGRRDLNNKKMINSVRALGSRTTQENNVKM